MVKFCCDYSRCCWWWCCYSYMFLPRNVFSNSCVFHIVPGSFSSVIFTNSLLLLCTALYLHTDFRNLSLLFAIYCKRRQNGWKTIRKVPAILMNRVAAMYVCEYSWAIFRPYAHNDGKWRCTQKLHSITLKISTRKKNNNRNLLAFM